MVHHFETAQWLPVPVEDVFLFFANPENLPRIMPPSTGTKLLDVQLVRPSDAPASIGAMVPVAGAGSKIVTSFRPLPFLPLRKRWIARVVEFEWNKYFADTQEQGPFKSFHHRHEVRSDLRDGKTGTLVKDVITYEIGFGLVDRVANVFIAAQLKKTFKYRQDALSRMLLPR